MKHIPGKVKFLVCVDSSEECKVALKFACMRAKNSGGEVILLYVVEPNDLQHFAGVEQLMKKEATEEAESILSELIKNVLEDFNLKIKSVVSYGDKYKKIIDLINMDKTISILVLGEAPEGAGTNYLVNKFSTGLTKSVHIPLTIVPGNLTDKELKKIT